MENKEFDYLLQENISLQDDCIWCKETPLDVGQKTDYGAIIIFKIGDSLENGWFATLSPKTGGPEKDFTIQLMPFAHLTHFSQMANRSELAKNYGVAFSKINMAMTKIMAEEEREFKAFSETRDKSVSIATYGKTTTWKEKKEHLHIKIFPFRGNIGQPYTVDSTFGRKKVHRDQDTGEEFIKMKPVRKKMIDKERFISLSNRLIELLK